MTTIPIHATYDISTGRDRIDITPEIHAQILAPAMERIAALEASNRCRLDEVLDCHRRIAALESVRPAQIQANPHYDHQMQIDAELTRELRELPLVAKEWEKERDRARTEAERWKERAEKASGEVAEAKARAERCYQCELNAEKERDAARAEAQAAKQEAAGLRARKVKLPGAQREDGILPTITARAEAWNACLGKCADAIRAAGIEVEG